MNERYIQYHLDVSEIADKLNEVLKEYALVDYHILRDEKTINKYYLVVGVSPLNSFKPVKTDGTIRNRQTACPPH